MHVLSRYTTVAAVTLIIAARASGYSISASASVSPAGAVPVGQTFTLTIQYSLSNASGGNHVLQAALELPQWLEVVPSTPVSPYTILPAPPGKHVEWALPGMSVTAGPFGGSGSGQATAVVVLRFTPGTPMSYGTVVNGKVWEGNTFGTFTTTCASMGTVSQGNGSSGNPGSGNSGQQGTGTASNQGTGNPPPPFAITLGGSLSAASSAPVPAGQPIDLTLHCTWSNASVGAHAIKVNINLPPTLEFVSSSKAMTPSASGLIQYVLPAFTVPQSASAGADNATVRVRFKASTPHGTHANLSGSISDGSKSSTIGGGLNCQ